MMDPSSSGILRPSQDLDAHETVCYFNLNLKLLLTLTHVDVVVVGDNILNLC